MLKMQRFKSNSLCGIKFCLKKETTRKIIGAQLLILHIVFLYYELYFPQIYSYRGLSYVF